MGSFFSMGTRIGFIFFLSAAVPLNFFRAQNLTAASPSGSPSVVTPRLECIRMPQTVGDLRRPRLVPSAVYTLRYPDRVRVLSLIGELGRVIEHKDGTIGGDRAVARRLRVTSQNVRLTDPVVGEKTIGCLGVGPVIALAAKRNAIS
jgi:hypothetical protein